MSLDAQMKELASRSKAAARQLTGLDTEQKNRCLHSMAQALCENKAAIGKANEQDLETARGMGLSQAMIDRLVLNEARIEAMAQGLREVAALPDPIGRILDERERPNGLLLQKITTPIGVVVIIFFILGLRDCIFWDSRYARATPPFWKGYLSPFDFDQFVVASTNAHGAEAGGGISEFLICNSSASSIIVLCSSRPLGCSAGERHISWL